MRNLFRGRLLALIILATIGCPAYALVTFFQWPGWSFYLVALLITIAWAWYLLRVPKAK